MIAIWIGIGLAVGLLIGLLIGTQKARELSGKLEGERQLGERLRSENERAWQERHAQSETAWQQRLETLRSELATKSAELAKANAEHCREAENALRDSNRQQIDALLQPIKEKFSELSRKVEETDTRSQTATTTLGDTFKSQMELFTQAQQKAVSDLQTQTLRVSEEAAELSRVIKGDNKMQGNWGEMLLQTLLEASGMREGHEFFTQEVRYDDEGRKMQPDVIVRFPNDGGEVIIDCKVSLKAYAQAVNSTNEAERKRFVKDHLESVRQHVKELSAKEYQSLAKKSIGFVFMFMPVEGSYIEAMKADPNLSLEAYKNHVVIISQTNLMSALQLIYNLWQQDRQTKNIEKIVKAGSDLYDKLVDFVKNFAEIGDAITKLQGRFDLASKRLSTGAGNVMKRAYDLGKMGIIPKKRLSSPLLPDDEEEPNDDDEQQD